MSSESALFASCPAKVNLSLRVLGKRPDGYHELDTVFQAIDLWDEVHASASDELTLTCDDPSVPVDATNLVLRAASRMRETFGLRQGARLHLRKRIPVGGGLGGGSSDAAGTLLLLGRLWRLSLTPGELESLAAGLGADVPFFLVGGTCRGTGRGDRIERLPPIGPMPILLGCPPFGTSTAEVYARLDARLTPFRDDVSVPPLSVRTGNDLEPVVFQMRPELAAFRDALVRHGAGQASLSGSGSSVFGVFGDAEGASRALEALQSRFVDWRLLSTRAIPGAAHVGG